jgi:hypothetical protein
MSVPGSCLAGQRGPLSQHIAVQRRVMVFVGLVHMLMTVPNLVFLFMRSPLIPFGFCSSYQLLIRFSAHSGGGGEGKGGSRENASVAEKAERAQEVRREEQEEGPL